MFNLILVTHLQNLLQNKANHQTYLTLYCICILYHQKFVFTILQIQYILFIKIYRPKVYIFILNHQISIYNLRIFPLTLHKCIFSIIIDALSFIFTIFEFAYVIISKFNTFVIGFIIIINITYSIGNLILLYISRKHFRFLNLS